METVQTRVFAVGRRGGNPCPVVLGADDLTSSAMQGLARSLGQDTVFVLRPHALDADVRLRFFVPEHEIELSGHATIAALTVALRRGDLRNRRIVIETQAGRFVCLAERRRRGCVVTVIQNAPAFGPPVAAGPVAAALRVSASAIAEESPLQVVSVSRPKLLVPLVTWRVLQRLTPDYEALWALCDAHHASGVYAFTRRTNKSGAAAEARQFPLRAGFLEDPATGVAAAALGAYLALHDLHCRSGLREFRIAQGYAMGAPSRLEAIAECAAGSIFRTGIRGMARVIRRVH